MASRVEFTNDELANAVAIGEGTRAGASIVENTSHATLSPGEPTPATSSTTDTVWYVYTPAPDGVCTLSTNGSFADTVLAVFEKTSDAQPLSYANLSVVAVNDDVGSSDDYASSYLYFDAAAHHSYYIQLGGYGGTSGDFLLTLTGPAAEPPCFVTGTAILTARGEVPVEALRIGDLAVTASGEHRPIRWIGHRPTDIARHPRPVAVTPVRIRADAIAPGVPARDLRVSPGHAVAVEGVLVKAGRLVNGATILRESAARVTYWHIELDSHDLLVADGLTAESYVDCGNRSAFDNGGPVVALHPAFDALDAHAARSCLPLVDAGPALAAIRGRLIARAGAGFSADPAVRVLADGVALAPAWVVGWRYTFLVREGTRALRLVSRSSLPCEALASSTDRRRLGVRLRNLSVDGAPVRSDALGEGWHPATGGREHRWSDGDAALPLGREIAFTVFPLERYPVEDGQTGTVAVRPRFVAQAR